LSPEYRPPRSGRGIGAWLFAAALFFLFVAIAGVGLWGVSQVLQLDVQSRLAARDGFLAEWETPAERQASFRAAFASTDSGVSSGELREFDRLFKRVIAARHDDEAFRKLVDLQGYARRVLNHPATRRAASYDEPTFEEDEHGELSNPTSASRHKILHVKRGEREGEALVYVLFDEWEGDHTVYRFWLRRAGRSWKICDWQRADLPLSQGATTALVQVLGSDPNGDGYHRTLEACNHRGDLSRAEQLAKLQALLDAPLPVDLHDYCKLLQAYSWHSLSRPRETLACFAAIQRPDECPGIYDVTAAIHSGREEHLQAIAAAEKYGQLTGFNPDLLELKATSLAALGRETEAIETWQQLVRLDGQNYLNWQSLARLLPDDEKTKLIDLLREKPKPLEAVRVLASLLLADGDEAAMTALEKFIAAQAPESPVLAEIQAQRASQAGDLLAAAELYWQLRQQAEDSDQQARYRSLYLDEMCAAREPARAYAQLVDDGEEPQKVFHEIVQRVEYDDVSLSLENLAPMFALHRQRAQHDPWLMYNEGLLLAKQGKDAAAEREIAAALAQIPAGVNASRGGDEFSLEAIEYEIRDNEQDEYVDSDAKDYDALRDLAAVAHMRTLARLGRAQEAWETYGDDPSLEAVQVIANALEIEQRFDDLEQFIASAEASGKSPGWCAYYHATDEIRKGHYPQAAWLLEQTTLPDDEVWRAKLLDDLKVEAYLSAGEVELAYRVNKERRDSFALLSSKLSTRRNYDLLTKLIAAHRAADADDPNLLENEVELHWRKLEYEAVIEKLTPWPADALIGLEPERLAQFHEWKVRSLLMLGLRNDARAAAKVAFELDDVHLPLLLVELSQGEMEQARELLTDRRFARETMKSDGWNDPALAALFLGPEFADLRTQFPPAAPAVDPTGTKMLLLTRAPPELTSDQIIERLKQAKFPAVEDSHTLAYPPGQRRSILLRTSLGQLIVTVGGGLYPALDDSPLTDALGQPLQRAIHAHGGWIAFDFEASPTVREDAAAKQFAQAVAAFCDGDTLAICGSVPGAYSKYAELADAAARERLQRGEPFPSGAAASNNFWWSDAPNGNYNNGPAARRQWIEWHKSLRGFVGKQPSAASARVKISLQRGHAWEDLWLDASHATRGEYGGYSLVGRLQSDSALYPHLPAGAIVSVSEYGIREWPAAE
jgi:hypothetical protein